MVTFKKKATVVWQMVVVVREEQDPFMSIDSERLDSPIMEGKLKNE